jgi:hypothetical protein
MRAENYVCDVESIAQQPRLVAERGSGRDRGHGWHQQRRSGYSGRQVVGSRPAAGGGVAGWRARFFGDLETA